MHSTSAPAPGAGLDSQALARLEELDPDGRHGVVQRVLTAYETSLQRMLAQLRGAQSPVSPEVVSSVAHTLKSSSASVGALALARTCAEVESKLRAGDATSLSGDLAHLIAEGEAALVAVAAILRK
jgi:HPt (histidine-containing phosphotransfer) domain-containing protein